MDSLSMRPRSKPCICSLPQCELQFARSLFVALIHSRLTLPTFTKRMFMSLTLSSIFSMIRRTGAGVAEGGGSGIVRNLTRRGLSRSVIDNLPVKRYEAPQADSTEDGGVVQDVSLRRQDSLEEDEMDSCAICLTEYEPGVTEVKTLPCGHQFRKECIDAWLNEKTTCPTVSVLVCVLPASDRSFLNRPFEVSRGRRQFLAAAGRR